MDRLLRLLYQQKPSPEHCTQCVLFFLEMETNITPTFAAHNEKNQIEIEKPRKIGFCINGHINSKHDIVCKYEPGAQLSPKNG